MRRPSRPRSDIEDNKKSIGHIQATCPDIDLIIAKLEELREDNATLRSLGQEWYEVAQEYYGVIEDMDDYIDKLEDDVTSLEDKINELENE